jgi:uncharacterized protein involved in exopolysaccharide biosynthesis
MVKVVPSGEQQKTIDQGKRTMNQIQQFGDIESIIRRQGKLFLIVFAVILLPAIFTAIILPPIYKSSATILIEEQQISRAFVQSTITRYGEERMQTITQDIMSRRNLLQILNKFDLYPELRAKKGDGELVEKLRKAIKLEPISTELTGKTGRSYSVTIAFKLSYEGKDPKIVQKVAKELSELYLRKDVAARQKMVQDTTAFFETELDQLKEQIRVHERKISKFKKEHMGQLPEQLQSNLLSVSRSENELEKITTRIRSLQEKKMYLEGQITNVDPLLPVIVDGQKVALNPNQQLKRLRLKLANLQATLSEKHPDIRKLKNEIKKLEAMAGNTVDVQIKIKTLKQKKTELAALKSRYDAKHPDIKRLVREVAILEGEVARSKAYINDNQVEERLPDNPTFINLKTQIAVTETEIRALQQDEAKLKEEIEEYDKIIGSAPMIEKEYSDLTRDYDSARRKYNEMLDKLMEAKIAQGMDQSQQGERLSISDPAHLPRRPSKPNRFIIVLLGFLVGAGLGSGTAVVREGLDNSIKSISELKEITGLPVFAIVSYIETKAEKRKRVTRLITIVFAATVTVIIITVTAIGLNS